MAASGPAGGGGAGPAGYALAARDAADRRLEDERLALVQALHDPLTALALDAAGIRPGGRAWDAGAGAGSVAAMLARRVGPGGEVVATDIDVSRLAALARPPVRVVRHDLMAAPPPATGLDLVHARLLLLHLADRGGAVARLAGALRPGGALVVGDIDFAGHAPLAPLPAWERVWEAFVAAVEEAGWDPGVGRRLPGLLEAAGLAGVEAGCHGGLVRGGSLRCRLQRLTFARLRPAMLATGRCAPAHLREVERALLDPARAFRAPTVWTAWGRAA